MALSTSNSHLVFLFKDRIIWSSSSFCQSPNLDPAGRRNTKNEPYSLAHSTFWLPSLMPRLWRGHILRKPSQRGSYQIQSTSGSKNIKPSQIGNNPLSHLLSFTEILYNLQILPRTRSFYPHKHDTTISHIIPNSVNRNLINTRKKCTTFC